MTIMIETARLKLVPCELAHFEAMFREHEELAALLRVSLAEEWYGFDEALQAMPFSYDVIRANPAARNWWTYLFIHKRDERLIGVGGFKGEADADGMVEIGYAIAPAYRRRGLATEAARALVEFAFAHPQVKTVQAHTLKDGIESIGVLKKAGMKLVGEFHDPEDGDVLRWRIARAERRKSWRSKTAKIFFAKKRRLIAFPDWRIVKLSMKQTKDEVAELLGRARRG